MLELRIKQLEADLGEVNSRIRTTNEAIEKIEAEKKDRINPIQVPPRFSCPS